MPRKANAKPALKTINFTLSAPQAKQVYVAGDFNEWSPEKAPLKLDKKSGEWKGSLKLQPGKYQYKFVVDGNWWIDPACSKNEWNQHGTQNSIIEIQ